MASGAVDFENPDQAEAIIQVSALAAGAVPVLFDPALEEQGVAGVQGQILNGSGNGRPDVIGQKLFGVGLQLVQQDRQLLAGAAEAGEGAEEAMASVFDLLELTAHG